MNAIDIATLAHVTGGKDLYARIIDATKQVADARPRTPAAITGGIAAGVFRKLSHVALAVGASTVDCYARGAYDKPKQPGGE